MQNDEGSGYVSEEERAAAELFNQKSDKVESDPMAEENNLLARPEVQDLLNRFKPADSTRKNLENILSSNDESYGTASQKIQYK